MKIFIKIVHPNIGNASSGHLKFQQGSRFSNAPPVCVVSCMSVGTILLWYRCD